MFGIDSRKIIYASSQADIWKETLNVTADKKFGASMITHITQEDASLGNFPVQLTILIKRGTKHNGLKYGSNIIVFFIHAPERN